MNTCKNQYSANIIAISNFDKALDKALDKANAKHLTKHLCSTIQSTCDIHKTINNKQLTINNKQGGLEKIPNSAQDGEKNKKVYKPSLNEISDYFKEKNISGTEAEIFLDHYESNGWMVGKAKMQDWKAAVRNWIRNINTNKFNGNYKKSNGTNSGTRQAPIGQKATKF